MSVVVVGLEHGAVPLDLLEAVALGEAESAKVLALLKDHRNVQEAVVLSTCLRTEIYGVVDRFHDAVEEIEETLAGLAGVDAAIIGEAATVRFDDDVATHLFSVAAGLESAVPGEGEVLGQVKRAWERAHAGRATGPVLAELFRHAVEAGKRVRSETGIARGTTSFSYAAVGLARSEAGGLGGKRVVVIGAGEMGAGVVRALTDPSGEDLPAGVTVANRTRARAEELAAEAEAVGGTAVRGIGLEGLPEAVAEAEVVLSAVEAEANLVGPGTVGLPTRKLVVVDLGMPRTVDPAVAQIEGVRLLDMSSLTAAVGRAMEDRRGEMEDARRIVAEEVGLHKEASRARGAAPVISALRGRWEEVRAGEFDRRRGKGSLSEEGWEEVEAVTKAVLSKLLHQPTVALRETAGTSRGERLVEALRTLFDL